MEYLVGGSDEVKSSGPFLLRESIREEQSSKDIERSSNAPRANTGELTDVLGVPKSKIIRIQKMKVLTW